MARVFNADTFRFATCGGTGRVWTNAMRNTVLESDTGFCYVLRLHFSKNCFGRTQLKNDYRILHVAVKKRLHHDYIYLLLHFTWDVFAKHRFCKRAAINSRTARKT